MYNMAKGFKAHGAELTLLSYNTTKHQVDPSELPAEYTELGDWHFVPVDNAIKPLGALLNLFSSKSYHISRFQTPEMEKQLIKLLSTNEYDVVHFEGLFTGIYLDVVKKHAPKAKTVLRAHNIEYKIWERMSADAKGLKRWYLKLLTKRLKNAELALLTKFDAVVPITSVDKAAFETYGVKEQFVSPTGFDMPVLEQMQMKPYSVYHLGSMDWLPNKEALIWFMEHVWFKVKSAVPEATFYIAGRNMPESFISFERVPGVKVIGEVPDAHIFVSDKMVSVIPILSGSGLRIKIIEGLSMGKAIVSTSIGAEGVDYVDGENIEIADSPDEFAERVISLLNDPKKVLEQGKKARQLAEQKYSNFALVGNLLDYYRELLTK